MNNWHNRGNPEQQQQQNNYAQQERSEHEDAAVLKVQTWAAYNGPAERFEQEWPTIHAQLLADSAKRQHHIDRTLGPYSLSAMGLMPHRTHSAGSADMLVPGVWGSRTKGSTTYPVN